MKRLLALLLALLLPGCAAAETIGVSLAVEVDEARFAAAVKQGLQSVLQGSEYNLDALSAALATGLNGLGFEVAVQDDATETLIRLGKGELLNMITYSAVDKVFLTSPMLSGYALWDELPAGANAEAVIAKTDWKSVERSVAEAISLWLADIVPTVTQGAFHGDAYSDGTQCITWVLSDMDVAALVSKLATDEVRAVFLNLMQAMTGLDGSGILAEFDEMNAQVADIDAYLYVLRMVTNDAGDFVGASLTIMDETTQVATLSFGMKGSTCKLVLGLGFREENYWWELSAKHSRQENITYLSGTSREWIADKSASYSYVSSNNAPLTSYVLRCTLTQSGERLLWDGSISLETEAESADVCSVAGSFIRGACSMDCSIALGGSGTDAPFRMKLKVGPVEPVAPMDSTLKLCSVTSETDAALYQELTDKFAASLVTRLIKLLPMDLIMTINQFTLPQ